MPFAGQGSQPIFGTSASSTPISFTIYRPSDGASLGSGYVMPVVGGFNVTHNAENVRTRDGSGDIQSTTGHGEFIECQFDLIPDASTLADSRKSATIPPLMSTIVVANADVIPCGPFADAINVNPLGSAPETSRWIYEGGGSIRMTQDGIAAVSLTLRRYPKIVGGTAITG